MPITLSTQASETTCRCGLLVMSAVDEGLRARVDARPLDEPVAAALLALTPPVRLYVLTPGRWLVERTYEGLTDRPRGTLHAAHRCKGAPMNEPLALFDVERVDQAHAPPPAAPRAAVWTPYRGTHLACAPCVVAVHAGAQDGPPRAARSLRTDPEGERVPHCPEHEQARRLVDARPRRHH